MVLLGKISNNTDCNKKKVISYLFDQVPEDINIIIYVDPVDISIKMILNTKNPLLTEAGFLLLE